MLSMMKCYYQEPITPGVDSSLETSVTCVGHYEIKLLMYEKFYREKKNLYMY